MIIKTKNYAPEHDFERVLDFLSDTYLETKSLANHFPNRFENDKDNYRDGIHLWEEFDESSNEKKIVGLSTPEKKFLYFIQIHPEYEYLLTEMVEWIVDHFGSIKDDLKKEQKLIIVCLDGYKPLEEILRNQGFEKTSNYGYLRFRDINEPIHQYSIPEGYSIRSFKGKEEYGSYTEAIRKTFGHGEFFNSEVVESINSNTYYNPELDLIIEAPNGEIAAFCTFRMDPKNRITELEPLGTLPNYKKLGLGKAILGEGYKRLKKYNPTLLYIGGAADTSGANRLYDSTGFTKKTRLNVWKKDFQIHFFIK
ncbi:MAG: hypothetical protein HeimC3_06650 [Candidatus Heimdallarchaeota archaeon LC_3]|nr:MAG: hypothetical protein HeimC3_06650 [Candidatus Heimdallarchaeota archaeon LC_3]